MRRDAVLLSVALVLAAAAMVPIGTLAAAHDGQAGNETDVAPGERLSGVLDVGEAELDTEVDSRTFGIQIARASTQEAEAAVVGERLGDIEERLGALEERKDALQRARENGSMSEGAYRARIAELAARTTGLERLANEAARAAGEIPDDLLAERGIDASAIRTLETRAAALGGQDVADIARGIAGPSVGEAPGKAGPGDRGPGEPGPGERPAMPDDDRRTDRNETEQADTDSRPGA